MSAYPIIRSFADADRAWFAPGRRPASRSGNGGIKVGNNTYLERVATVQSGADVVQYMIRLHRTVIVTYTQGGHYIIDNGGYATAATRNRINAHTPFRCSIVNRTMQLDVRRGDWTVRTDEEGSRWRVMPSYLD